jgi:hypothetical protein
MVKKNNLFELIRSLSPSEKRFFRQAMAGLANNESNYLRLFDAIDTMDVYDKVSGITMDFLQFQWCLKITYRT